MDRKPVRLIVAGRGGDRWFVDETCVTVSGRWMYLHRAVDQFGQVIDVFLSERRDLPAARRFFEQALSRSTRPAEINTDRAGVNPTPMTTWRWA